jgi:hypothetical protein
MARPITRGAGYCDAQANPTLDTPVTRSAKLPQDQSLFVFGDPVKGSKTTHNRRSHHLGAGAYGEIGWHVMQTTEDILTAVPTKLADLHDVPLAEMPTLSMVTLDEALGRVILHPQTTGRPIAAFSSAI